ncbi:hypothetical protein PLICRDRAFT_46578 [Plicaturopsis crispa FD-325 SS-3]|uniref:P-loop containing nucleoside triphosphate hydrolase protein n=1 Tax=Plicaturopsis crispa FD-325 SS-3 TaxID=944288 RepID=A0A0C9T4I5_PLICR|nr:hypothetical protein PLICRDRAFT_46578 [Plicaturopsis crispa FD-325 SS-3]
MLNGETPRLAKSQYAVRSKELLSLVKQLRAIGAQADLDLPRITVIGNQSAGKSSVVEAISGITVPRDAGTCTRCPMECRMSSSDKPWSCQVYIRWEFDASGKRSEKVHEEPFGGVITDKGDVELALRRAQTAVLHPTFPPQKFLHMSAAELSKLGRPGDPVALPFSQNAVCVDLEGPDCTDLSFIDLPGIIQNADPHVVKLVEDLVVSHIKGNCLILVALPITDDIENQKALRLARKEDPAGRRTIGVITKLDLLSVGSTKVRDLWLEVIEGRRHALRHGYFCTRQPDDDERAAGVTPESARAAEADFFATTQPWAASVHQHRFGTSKLTATLSSLLVRVIDDTLPNIRAETTRVLDICKRELAALPKGIDQEPATYMLSLITDFSSRISQYAQGTADARSLIQENRVYYTQFKEAIRATAPYFVPYTSRKEEPRFDNRLDDDEPASESKNRPFFLDDMRRHIDDSITRELPNNVPFDAKVVLIDEFQSTWENFATVCFDRVRKCMLKTLLECISKYFGGYEGLRNHLNVFVSELVEQHYDSCLSHIAAILEGERTPFTQNDHYLATSKDKWLAKYKEARAGQKEPSPAQGIAASTLSSPFSFANPSAISSPAKAPSSAPAPLPFSFAKPLASSVSGSKPASSKGGPPVIVTTPETEFRSPAPSPSPFVLPVPQPNPVDKLNAALAALADLGYSGITAEDLGKLNPPDEYETELEAMAEVRGYFQVAYKRVIDNVPILIDLLFVKAVSKDVQSFLVTKLGLGTANATARCAQYLAEDPNIVQRRDELVARKKRLENVADELYNFGL